MTSAQIRQQFIDFFVQKHGHTFVPSSPVVPLDDPTLLFTNAGMNQFKPIFLGQEKRSYSRAVNTQKCIRAGGKHNDLDDVGRSRRHHTFFEMLGNWSFGDYFKRDAIAWSWELLTKVWKLDPTRLHVTVHAGDPAIGVPRDDEAASLWRDVAGVPQDHIHYGNTKDNFWEMGETGPCGPCTEIFVDRTPDRSGGATVLSGEDPRVMEIWNNVFIQYNRNADRSLTPLPAQHVDTGMGLERIIQVLQGKDDNYGIDLFDPFWAKLKEISGITYTGKYPKSNSADPVAEAADAQLRHDIAFRVIADHIRCLTFALTDGAVPSNEGRGYVLRRILRRAVRFGRQQLNLRDPFLFKLVDVVVEAMGGAFPELKTSPAKVIEIIREEETSFSRTIDRGIDLFEQAANVAKANAEQVLVVSAEDAFRLHDTYGFPIDLTRIMAEERGMQVDTTGYEVLMERARDLARSGGKEQETTLTQLSPAALAALGKDNITATNDQPKYSGEAITAVVKAIWNGSQLVDHADAGSDVAVILDRTNHYAEMGGQIGDAGTIKTTAGTFDVTTTRVVGSYVLHVGKAGRAIKVADAVTVTVDAKRHKTQQSHTTTHVANWALREVLGDDVQQKGSLVDPDKLRFDFSHGKSMSDPEVERVEELVNAAIKQSLNVYTDVVPQEQALKIHGLRAVFGEKYPPLVRVVSIGVPVKELIAEPSNPKWRNYSIEFCGGTHLGSTGEAETFVVVAEESVSKGIRRIVALTGEAAAKAQTLGKSVDSLITEAGNLPDEKLPEVLTALQKSISSGDLALRAKRRAQAAVTTLQDRYRKFEKASKSQAQSSLDVGKTSDELLATATVTGGAKIVVAQLADVSQDQLLSVVDSLRKKSGSYGILLASTADGKVSLVAAVSDDLIAKGLKAGDWIREAAKATGGGGGGRPQMAQAGGKDPAKIPDALEVARAFAGKTLG